MNRLTFNVRYGILNKVKYSISFKVQEKFIIYEKDTRDKVAVEIELDKIVSIELMVLHDSDDDGIGRREIHLSFCYSWT